MRKPVAILLLFFGNLIFSETQAQDINLPNNQKGFDSLWAVWNDESKADTVRLAAMNDIAWDGFLFTKPDSAFYFAQLGFDFAQSRGLKKQMTNALNTQGASFYIRGNFRSAIDYYTRCLTIKEEIGDKKGMATSLNNIGSI